MFRNLILFSTCFASFFLSRVEAKIIEIDSIQTSLEYIDEDSLVLFNIANTLYEPSVSLADHKWRQYFANRVTKIIENRVIRHKITNQVLNKIVTLPKKTIESITPELIAGLQKKQIIALGITKKEVSTPYANDFALVTSQHLINLGINLEDTLPYLKFNASGFNPDYAFTHGIIFSNGRNTAPMLLNFLENVSSPISQIVYIDNSRPTLEMCEALLSPISFIGLHYPLTEGRKERPIYAIGIIQLLALYNEQRVLSDAEAFQLYFENPEFDYEELLDQFIRQKVLEA